MKKSLFLLALSLATAASLSAAGTLANLSSRGLVGQSSGSLIAGFVVEGTGPKAVLIRGVGPGLAQFGVGNPAADIAINVYDGGGNLVAANDGFLTDPNAATVGTVSAAVGAFALTSASRDAAVLTSLEAGSYTAVVSGVGGATGTALVEIYVVP